MGSLADIPDREDAGQTAGSQVHKKIKLQYTAKVYYARQTRNSLSHNLKIYDSVMGYQT